MYVKYQFGDGLDFVKAWKDMQKRELQNENKPSIALIVIYSVLFSIPILLLLGKYSDIDIPIVSKMITKKKKRRR